VFYGIFHILALNLAPKAINIFAVIADLRKVRQYNPRNRFFLVSLCLQANAEMVPKFPSCYYMLLM